MTGSAVPSAPVADAPKDNWVDRFAPAWARPYLRLARLDRPIGTWLLLFPCLWSAELAAIAMDQPSADLGSLLLFAIGALVMRGAGCAYNDYVDREYDAKVQRTQSRPIPSGQVTPRAALVFTCLLSFIGLAVLISFNTFTIFLAIASLALVAIYPFMKRFTYWPQAVLGLTFNWGALVGWAAEAGSLALAPVLLYFGAFCWTIAYDTIYAHQDAEDDLSLGLKSTALRFGEASPKWVAAFFVWAVALWAAAALLAGAGLITFAGLAFIAFHFAWQVVTLNIHDGANCLARFRSNRTVGFVLFATLAVDALVSAG